MDDRVYEQHLSRITELQRLIELEEQKLHKLLETERETGNYYCEHQSIDRVEQYAS